MTCYTAFGQTLASDVSFDQLLPVAPLGAIASIKVEQAVNLTAGEQPTNVHRKGVNAKISFDSDKVVNISWEGIARFQLIEGHTLRYEATGCDEGTLRIFLLSEPLGILLWQQGYFLLHGSAVQINHRAYVFVGVPGAGKSTTAAAFHQAGNTVLTDDLVAIQFVDNQAFVVPAFPSLKVWKTGLDGLGITTEGLKNSFEGVQKFMLPQSFTTFPEQAIPLARITCLERPFSRKKNEFIPPIERPVELLKYFPLPNQLLIHKAVKKHFEQATQLASHVELWRQRRPKNFNQLNKFTKTYATY